STAAALAVVLANQSSVAAPAGIATAIATMAQTAAKGGAATGIFFSASATKALPGIVASTALMLFLGLHLHRERITRLAAETSLAEVRRELAERRAALVRLQDRERLGQQALALARASVVDAQSQQAPTAAASEALGGEKPDFKRGAEYLSAH